ncbi:hypothetical protein, partial [Methylobacterium radiotolerans]|uniref:hypothetical protein n=1 Tax=Methylobacterium radiotolerans TaxID=31998 RepID=UPI000B921D3B
HPSCGPTWRASMHIGQAAGPSQGPAQNSQVSLGDAGSRRRPAKGREQAEGAGRLRGGAGQ